MAPSAGPLQVFRNAQPVFGGGAGLRRHALRDGSGAVDAARGKGTAHALPVGQLHQARPGAFVADLLQRVEGRDGQRLAAADLVHERNREQRHCGEIGNGRGRDVLLVARAEVFDTAELIRLVQGPDLAGGLRR